MQRITTSTASPNMFGTGKPGFRDGDKSSGVSPTQLNAAFFNAVQEEICTVIEAAGIALSSSSNAQLYAALKILFSGVSFATSAETIAGTSTSLCTNPAGVKAAIAAQITALINASPSALDTLKELADAMGDDSNFATNVYTAIAAKLSKATADTLYAALSHTHSQYATANTSFSWSVVASSGLVVDDYINLRDNYGSGLYYVIQGGASGLIWITPGAGTEYAQLNQDYLPLATVGYTTGSDGAWQIAKWKKD